MCVVCGCNTQEHKTELPFSPRKTHAPAAHAMQYRPLSTAHEHKHAHDHTHPHTHPHEHDLHYGLGSAKVSVPGMSQARTIQIEQDVLGANQRYAEQNRAHFAKHGVLALNFVSSPGSGKTTLLCETIRAYQQRHPQARIQVIEGDQQTSHDAERIRATGVAAIQINTGKGCHLDAQMIGDAYAHLHSHEHEHVHDNEHAGMLFIENVGNLVCPALWDLGEAAKVAILSITEGEDKPLKYPDMFAAASLMLISKIDLLPHLDFDLEKCRNYALSINPNIQILELSSKTGQGMDAWLDWLEQAQASVDHHEHA